MSSTPPPAPPSIDSAALLDAARELDGAPAVDIIRWAVERFGSSLVLATSMTDTVMVHLATSVDPNIEVVFLDTGFHFAETLGTLRKAVARHALRITVERPAADAADVWAAGSAACCHARKVAPLDRALAGRSAWMAGLRRADGVERAETPVVQLDRRGLVKVNPIATWSDTEVEAYQVRHDLVRNPLIAEGYPSIGCWPCTEPAGADDPRAGRWVDSDRTECGLHL